MLAGLPKELYTKESGQSQRIISLVGMPEGLMH